MNSNFDILENCSLPRVFNNSLAGKKAIGYGRVSSPNQKNNTSLEDQREKIIATMERLELVCVDIFTEVKSATKPYKRKKFQELIELAKKGEVEVIIFPYADRMARNCTDLEIILSLVEDYNITIVLIQENMILQKPLDMNLEHILTILIATAKLQARMMKERCLGGIKKSSSEGFRPNLTPFGYKNDLDMRKAIVNDDEAEIVKKCFDLAETGLYTFEQICDEIEGLGYTYNNHPSGKIPVSTLASLLRNRFYTGSYVVKQTGQVVQGNHKAIITKEQFEKVQKVYETQTYSNKHNAFYAGRLICDSCGHPMTPDVKLKGGKTYEYYRCRNPKCNNPMKTTGADVDGRLASYLKEIRLGLIPKSMVQEVLDSELAPVRKEIAVLNRDISRRHEALNKLEKDIAENHISDNDYIQFHKNEITRRYGNIETQIEDKKKFVQVAEEKVHEAMQNSLSTQYAKLDCMNRHKVLDMVSNLFKITPSGLKMTFKPTFRKLRKR